MPLMAVDIMQILELLSEIIFGFLDPIVKRVGVYIHEKKVGNKVLSSSHLKIYFICMMMTTTTKKKQLANG